MENTKILGLFYSGNRTLIRFGENFEHTPLSVGRAILRRIMKEEEPNMKFNSRTRVQYLKEFAEYMVEISESDGADEIPSSKPEDWTDYVASHIVSSNAPHIMGMDRIQVSNDYRSLVEKALVDLFENDLKELKTKN